MRNLILRRLSILLPLSVTIILNSCQKDEDISPEDKLLQDQLIGTWISEDYTHKTISFYSNNTFTDSIYYITSSNPNGLQLFEVINGNFNVDDGQLTFSKITLTYTKSQEFGYPYHEVPYESLNNISYLGKNTLIIAPKTRLVQIGGTNSTINGKWYSSNLIGVYDKTLDNILTGGTSKSIFEFNSDSIVNWQYETTYENIHKTYNRTTRYDFNNSVLDLHQWGFIANVSFTKNEMFWIYYEQYFQKVK